MGTFINTDGLVNNTSAEVEDVKPLFDTLDEELATRIPAGTGAMWFSNTAPTGWLICDGSAISRTTYSFLFAVIGTTFGVGDGSTTFNLPNLKGRVPVGRDAAQTEFDDLAETGGAKTHTLTTGEMPAHSHGLSALKYDTGGSGVPNMTLSGVTSGIGESTDSAGSGGAHNNLQPYVVINYIIKT